MAHPQIGIIMGSKNDLDIVQPAIDLLTEFGVRSDLQIVSAHRTPDRIGEYAKWAEENGLVAIIAAAGGSAHLPGMTASETRLPVIALPIKREHHGDEALKSSIAMPAGIPLAVVPNNGAVNAALLALRILATSQADLNQKLEDYRQKMHDQVLIDNENLQDRNV